MKATWLVATAVLVCAFPRHSGGQQLDQLETDDYLDPRLFRALAAVRNKQIYGAWWITGGQINAYHQRTESEPHSGFTTTAVGELYWKFFQASAKFDRVAARGTNTSFQRVRLEIAGYLNEADSSPPMRYRYARLFESRGAGITDRGWSVSADFKGVIGRGDDNDEGQAGLIVTRFASRHETTFLFFERFPWGIESDWFSAHWGLQYGHTWFNDSHPGVERNSFKIETSGDFLVPGIPARHDARVVISYLPSFSPGRHVRHDLSLSGSFLFPSIWF
jgi:hypothetical protein